MASETVRWNIQPFIDGKYHESAAVDYFDNINPADETRLCEVAVGDARDVDVAVASARKSFEARVWAGQPALKRAAVLERVADLVVRDALELATLDSLEMGKPIQASLSDVGDLAASMLKDAARFTDRLVGTSSPLHPRRLTFNYYEPRGVVGAIAPWNFPTANAVIKFGPALAAGNSVVLKPSEISSGSALRLAELALEAGVPEGVLNVVPGLGNTVGQAIAAHPDIDLVSFTGSTSTGRRIMEAAGRSNGKPLLLECGGKSPMLVFDDIENLDMIADAAAQSILRNSGQVCSASTRLFVHQSLKDELVRRLLARLDGLRAGDPLDAATTFGPLASPAQRDRVAGLVEDGVAAGATVCRLGPVQRAQGCLVLPTVFDDVDSGMAIAREEIFGPVLCVRAFVTDDEAAQLANATEYGLGATIWTKSIGRAMNLAQAVRVGNVSIRTSGPEDPDPGYVLSREPRKASGFGPELGLEGLQSYSTLKSVSISGA